MTTTTITRATGVSTAMIHRLAGGTFTTAVGNHGDKIDTPPTHTIYQYVLLLAIIMSLLRHLAIQQSMRQIH